MATTFRFRGESPPTESSRASVLEPTIAAGGVAELYLYDPIDSWGGWWGVSAKEFAESLAQLPDDTSEIRLHLNCGGGEVWDAVAISNQLRRHKARVVVVVDGIAASAASMLAVTSDETIMGLGSQLMIHDAWTFTMGNEADHLKAAGLLAKDSNTLAGMYAAKAGGTVEAWRDLMREETWYTAEEAVRDGLADRVEGQEPAEAASAALVDLSLFRYQGRAEAPAPRRVARLATQRPPGSYEPGQPNRKENSV